MKNIIRHSIFAAALLLAVTSCNFLDVNDYFNETLKYDSVFHNKRNLERYLGATASLLMPEGNFYYVPGPMACDEGFCLTNDFPGSAYANGLMTPSTDANGTGGMRLWDNYYKIIRKCNTIIARMDEAVDLTAFDKRDLMGTIYFLRAYAYYNMMMVYGPLVLLGDDIMDNNEDPAYYDRYRATFDETVDYICDELEKAALYLPTTVTVANFGAPTRGAAYGLISRIRLIQASPLYNGGAAARIYFGDWKRTYDGVNYVSQTYDERKWAVAAAAAKRVMDMNMYQLHTVERKAGTRPLPTNTGDPNLTAENFPYGAANIDPFSSYSDMFTSETLPQRNTEFVWGRMFDATYNYLVVTFPLPRLNMGGLNCFGVTQKIIDNYMMEDGHTINDSSTDYPYSTTGTVGTNIIWDGPGHGNATSASYQLAATASNMYKNREMRFYASISFSQCYWPATTNTTAANKLNGPVSYAADGSGGLAGTYGYPLNYPITGYNMRKYVHAEDAYSGSGATRLNKAFPIIRYAEILLNYAEALNNLQSSYDIAITEDSTYHVIRDEAEMAAAFNQVRYRAGLPGLTAAELADADKIQELLERERMVEFIFEDRRYYDVRRWGKYLETESEPMQGMNVEANEGPDYYQVVPINHSKARARVADKKLVLLPLDLNEVRKATLLDQNPGWQD
ncbi:MAG: RagB/SusD family nutrient uptake outer membrane protein [Bacteroidales bacterium]|jgi:hypothetical protein|nr:RagB/SusD family nutrient uptake outer membrane protein [Bacteroidales bacterium]